MENNYKNYVKKVERKTRLVSVMNEHSNRNVVKLRYKKYKRAQFVT